ncbi:hypothetical protein [Streptomyces virginiae]|uniref:hypothetical protein n=1 Tax=Streptomyces virginiae TaxID=1961 RepID=UPI000526FF20|nr:hypothetical protein [Streptomyces virginiae]
MSGALNHAGNTLNPYNLAWDQAVSTGATIATGTSPTATLTAVGLLVTIAIAALGWYIAGTRRTRDRTADVTNTDLNALITQLLAADIEARRIQGLPGPAGGNDFKELTRLAPQVDSHGAQCPEPLPVLISDVVQIMKDLIDLPVDSTTPFSEYGVRVQQQTRAVDKLLASIDKALTSARQMRS